MLSDIVRLPRLLLPAPGVDLHRFAVIACDQFTAEPSYWANTECLVGAHPSALRLTLPEVFLPQADRRIPVIHDTMHTYLQETLLRPLPEGLMLVERDSGRGVPRCGVMLAFDLEAYDETPGACVPIRPTEATVTERVPARLAIRAEAPIELPHILLFLDDPTHTVLEALFEAAAHLAPIYDFPLMQGGGQLTGRLLPCGEQTDAFFDRLAAHAAPDACRARCADNTGPMPLVFATGDGNHSMAAAKAHWEQLKRRLPPAARAAHPARWVLAELVNLHDESICFEAVHRLLLQTDIEEVVRFFAARPAPAGAKPLPFSYRAAGRTGTVTLPAPRDALPVAVLQQALDDFLAAHPQTSIDFIHGTDTLLHLADQPDRVGFLLPDFAKNALFPQVLRAGVLPRKTFSMGTALEKRYYLEARPITPEAVRQSFTPATGSCV